MISTLPLALLALPVALAMPAAQYGANPTTTNKYPRPHFASLTTWDFTTATALPPGLQIDTGTVNTSPLAHSFDASNVDVSGGFLNLRVPGGQAGNDVISCAEVATTFKIKYASVRTYAILTDTHGVCNGMFFYKDDSQEMDIEWLSDPNSQSNLDAHNGTRALFYTNQATDGNPADRTSLTGPSLKDCTTHVHEYRLEWGPNYTKYFYHGALQQMMTTNIPTDPGAFIWNNWADGDPAWTVGPPKTDAVFKIKMIVMEYTPA